MANNISSNKTSYDYLSPIEGSGNYVHPQQYQHQEIIECKPQETANKITETPTTFELLMEFDNVYDAVELNHLTPPQTPPRLYTPPGSLKQNEQQIDVDLYTFIKEAVAPQRVQELVYQPQTVPLQQNDFVFNQSFMQNVTSSTLADQEISIIFENNNNVKNDSAGIGQEAIQAQEQHIHTEQILSSDIARELQVVDELVRSRAKDLPDWTDMDEDYSSATSSSSFSPRSDESSSVYSQDDDWSSITPPPPKKAVKPKKSGLNAPLAGVQKVRTRPYQRGAEDKKSRKKEQNKNAATRYRQKKKQEIEVIIDEERILHDEYLKLKSEYNDKKREKLYLRGLLKEIYKARGFI